MDEAPEKRTKMDTSYTPVDEIEGLVTVTAKSSNFIGFAGTWVKFDMSDVTSKDIPEFVQMLTEMNDLITGPDASEWVQKHKGTSKDVKLAMYLLKCYNNILHVLGKASQDVLQHQVTLSQDWTPIDKTPMQTSKRLHAKALERATEVFEGTITPPECTLWETSLAKLAEERKETLLLKAKLGVNNRAIANGNGSGGGGGLSTGPPSSTRRTTTQKIWGRMASMATSSAPKPWDTLHSLKSWTPRWARGDSPSARSSTAREFTACLAKNATAPTSIPRTSRRTRGGHSGTGCKETARESKQMMYSSTRRCSTSERDGQRCPFIVYQKH